MQVQYADSSIFVFGSQALASNRLWIFIPPADMMYWQMIWKHSLWLQMDDAWILKKEVEAHDDDEIMMMMQQNKDTT